MHKAPLLLLSFACLGIAVSALEGTGSCGCSASPLELTFGGKVDDCCCEYTDVDSINGRVGHILDELGDTTFFRYFKVNIRRDCPFWQENPQCMSQHCALDDREDGETPKDDWQERIARVDFSHQGFPVVMSCTSKERDFCMLEDTDPDSIYLNLQRNPETYTGYDGPSSHRIWSAIYEENCFNTNAENPMTEECVEARSFYRVISGMHASIAAHIGARYHDGEINKYYVEDKIFEERLAKHPDRVKNLYFAYVVVLRAVTKLGDYLTNYQIASGDQGEDLKVQALLQSLASVTTACPQTFNEQILFNGDNSESLRQQFKERFRNISRVTDCVSCEKCRLWSKVQITGYGTAFKILFSYDAYHTLGEVDYELTRNELVALIQTLRLLSESLRFVDNFRVRVAQKALDASSPAPPALPTVSQPSSPATLSVYDEVIKWIQERRSWFLVVLFMLLIVKRARTHSTRMAMRRQPHRRD